MKHSQESPTYALARHIHEALTCRSGVITVEEARTCFVLSDGHPPSVLGFDAWRAKTQRIAIIGMVAGHKALQSLTHSKNDVFYFTTTYMDGRATPGGRNDREFYHIDQGANLDALEPLATSVFMKALVDIANARPMDASDITQ